MRKLGDIKRATLSWAHHALLDLAYKIGLLKWLANLVRDDTLWQMEVRDLRKQQAKNGEGKWTSNT